MSVITCPHCQAQLNAPPAAAGRIATCKRCKGRFEIPLPAALPAADQAPKTIYINRPPQSIGVLLHELALRFQFQQLLKVCAGLFAVLAWVALVAPRTHLTRVAFLTGAVVFVALAISSLAAMIPKPFAFYEKAKFASLGIYSLGVAIFLGVVAPRPAIAHPVFNTPLTGMSEARPAIQVEVIDATWHGKIYDSTYDLYLCVKSSRSDNAVMFPLNNEIHGCTTHYIQLPFEIANDDKLDFQLVYQSGLSPDEQQLVLEASQAAGYCLVYAGEIRWPNHRDLCEAAFLTATDVIGKSLNLNFRQKLTALAHCEYIVDGARPHVSQNANQVTLVQDDGQKKLARAQVRVYYPLSPIE